MSKGRKFDPYTATTAAGIAMSSGATAGILIIMFI